MNSKSQELADASVKAIKDFVKREVDPVREHVRGIAGRADKHYRQLEALEARIGALERKLGQKSGAVKLIKADNG